MELKNLSRKEKRRIEDITRSVVGILPFAFLIIASLIFILAYGNSNDLLMKVIKIGLLIFCLFAGYTLVKRVIDLIKIIKEK